MVFPSRKLHQASFMPVTWIGFTFVLKRVRCNAMNRWQLCQQVLDKKKGCKLGSSLVAI